MAGSRSARRGTDGRRMVVWRNAGQPIECVKNMKHSKILPRVNVNKQLTRILSGYQDLMDRYGADDPLVLGMKVEVDRKRDESHTARFTERRHAGAPSGVWNRIPPLPGHSSGRR